MIAGLGLDVVDLASFRGTLASGAFVDATFTSAERKYCETEAHGDALVHFAARFAAKEAALKALDAAAAALDLNPPHVALVDVEVVRDARGRPSLALHGAARTLADALEIAKLHVSLTHDGPTAAAVVVAER